MNHGSVNPQQAPCSAELDISAPLLELAHLLLALCKALVQPFNFCFVKRYQAPESRRVPQLVGFSAKRRLGDVLEVDRTILRFTRQGYHPRGSSDITCSMVLDSRRWY